MSLRWDAARLRWIQVLVVIWRLLGIYGAHYDLDGLGDVGAMTFGAESIHRLLVPSRSSFVIPLVSSPPWKVRIQNYNLSRRSAGYPSRGSLNRWNNLTL
ncbi:hypothetical protein VTK56DRAFT_3755 [Thermocarpiscus australiensis]